MQKGLVEYRSGIHWFTNLSPIWRTEWVDWEGSIQSQDPRCKIPKWTPSPMGLSIYRVLRGLWLLTGDVGTCMSHNLAQHVCHTWVQDLSVHWCGAPHSGGKGTALLAPTLQGMGTIYTGRGGRCGTDVSVPVTSIWPMTQYSPCFHIHTDQWSILNYGSVNKWKQEEYWVIGQIPNNKLYYFQLQQYIKKNLLRNNLIDLY